MRVLYLVLAALCVVVLLYEAVQPYPVGALVLTATIVGVVALGRLIELAERRRDGR